MLNKFSAILLLCLVAFPALVKTGHDFFHREDFHCSSGSSHLHQHDHHCKVCDFYFSIATPTELITSHPVLSFFKTDEPNFQPGILFAVTIPHRSLRGPPIIS